MRDRTEFKDLKFLSHENEAFRPKAPAWTNLVDSLSFTFKDLEALYNKLTFMNCTAKA